MSIAVFISTVSVAVALLSFAANFMISQRAAVRARKPVLVFVDDPEHGCWVLRNVGNGPALNVLVAQRAAGQWFNPVLVPPFGKDSAIPLTWLGRINITGLGASYSDFEDRRYSSTLGGDRSRTYEGDQLPQWTDDEVKRYWELPEGPLNPTVHWSERASSFQT
jgi:hypothetical protein